MQDKLIPAYKDLLASGTIKPDAAQADAVAALARLARALTRYHPAALAPLAALLNGRQAAPQGLYIHGPVGRGKTMLMDLFFSTLVFRSKRRLHFDAFMAETHAAIEVERGRGLGDPMPGAAKSLAAKGLVLCLDEFQVNDIADAMILSRLFRNLFERGLVLIATSNTPPGELYRHGLNRELFLPFIVLLTQHTEALKLTAARDYRLDKLVGRQLYFSPLDVRSHAQLQEAWYLLAAGAAPTGKTLEVAGRRLVFPRVAGGTLWTAFAELCEQPLGAADYRAIAQAFHTVILEGIPVMGPERRNEARRFIILIDALYDSHVRLIASAAAEPDAIYAAGDGSEAFHRTASRLIEMRSQDYLEAAGPAALPADATAD